LVAESGQAACGVRDARARRNRRR